MKKILFISEKSILDFAIAYSNDVNLLLKLLEKKDVQIYLVNPEDLILSKDQKSIQSKIVTINDFQKINDLRRYLYLKSSLHMLFSLPLPNEFKSNLEIRNEFSIKDDVKIEKAQIDIIIDRAEPVSRTKEYYNITRDLYDLNNNYFDDPIFREKEGDKEIVLKIDQELTRNDQQNLGFKTIILDFSAENKNLDDINRHKLYRIFQDLKECDLGKIIDQTLGCFQDLDTFKESAIISIIKKIYNCQINFKYFCIKPANWYGGVAIELVGDKKNKIVADLSKVKLFHLIAKINYNILSDVKKDNDHQESILKRAILDGIIIQEQVSYPKFGDLRIFVSFGKIHGVILRVPAKNKNIANMSAGGHAEIFINPINKSANELFILQKELEILGYLEIFEAISDLINSIKNSLETNVGKNLKKSAFIGFDALLNEDGKKKYFACNEINLSSAMGQNQIEVANLLEELLKNKNFLYALQATLNKIRVNENIFYELQNVKSPYVKFLILRRFIEDLSDEDKSILIEEFYLQIRDINFTIISVADCTINKIINA